MRIITIIAKISTIISVTFLLASSALSQQLVKDFNHLMEIPGLITIDATPTHFYALSENDGLIVFRVTANGLEWLYSSEGMQRRGNRLQADIRFAYLMGDDNRLTVIEPTSVLGVYSSTTLPFQPNRVARVGDTLFITGSANGLFSLNLNTPESVDSEPERVLNDILGDADAIGVRAFSSQLLVLTDNSEVFQISLSGDEPELVRTYSISLDAQNLFIANDVPKVSDRSGRTVELTAAGNIRPVFTIGSSIDRLLYVDNTYIIRTVDGNVWVRHRNQMPELVADNPENGNHIAVTRNRLWISDHGMLSPASYLSSAQDNGDEISTEEPQGTFSGQLRLKPIPNQIIPFPRPVLASVELEGNVPNDGVSFQIRSSAEGATIKNQGFYWQPNSRNVGVNRFTIVATTADGQSDEVSFEVDVRAFNMPPRFNPTRPLSIPVGETFELPIRATDPDGIDSGLIRYLGVDLPDGSTLNESTGLFTWTPTRRQEGTHEFQVIATDQFGSAASQNITINVLSISRDN